MDRAAFKLFATLEAEHWWFRGRRELYVPLLRDRLDKDRQAPRSAGDQADEDQSALTVLDVGCGVGGFLNPMSELGRVFGCELDQQAVQFCRDRGHAATFVARSDGLPVAPGSVDVFTLWDVLEHTPDDAAVLAELFRCLAPGGHLALSVPAYQWLYANNDRVAHHHRRYTRGGLVAKLTAAGFEVRHATYVNVILGLVIIPAVLLIKLKELLRPVREDTTTNLSWTVPRPLNALLARLFAGERHVLKHVSAPFGHSLFAVARRPLDPLA